MEYVSELLDSIEQYLEELLSDFLFGYFIYRIPIAFCAKSCHVLKALFACIFQSFCLSFLAFPGSRFLELLFLVIMALIVNGVVMALPDWRFDDSFRVLSLAFQGVLAESSQPLGHSSLFFWTVFLSPRPVAFC